MKKNNIKIFIAGIMQGSHVEAQMHGQDYRSLIHEQLLFCFPDAEIYDPLADHGSSLNYDETQGKGVFMNHNHMCSETDVVVAYVPQASMGTAIEMWEAYRNGRVVITISPLSLNWAVKFLSNFVYADMAEFIVAVKNGQLKKIIEGAI